MVATLATPLASVGSRQSSRRQWRKKGEIVVSEYLECTTVLADRKFLVAALAELGYHAEVHPDGATLFRYEGRERPERAHVIIRRKELSPASNDIGFARSSD